MSGILLQYNTDGSVIDRNNFNKMLSSLDHRGPDAKNIVYLNKAALGCQQFWTTPEEVNEIQPLSKEDRDCYLLFEGRLDNRDELFKHFDIKNKKISDGTLILEIYCKFNTEFFKDLLGSYVFLIYDSLRNRVVIVRDHLGDKILYYYYDRKKFIVASEPASILNHPDIPLELNDKKIAEYFTLRDHTDSSSFFKNIYEILPAHYLVFNGEELNIKRYWDLDPHKKIRYVSDEDYAEHFRNIFQKSVECRLRTIGDAGIMMSGGIDSTSVAAIAVENFKSVNKLKTFSYVFDKFNKSDESEYIDEFCCNYNVESTRVNGDDCWPLKDFKSWPVNPAFPYQDPFQWLKIKLFDNVAKNGVRTLLTGWFADELFTSAEYWLKDYISDYKILNAVFGTAKLVKSAGIRNIRYNTPLRIALRPLKFIRDSIFNNIYTDQEYPWLTEYSKSILPENLYWSEFTKHFYRHEQAKLVVGLRTSLGASVCTGCYNESILDLRFPFRDRRLVEYFFQIPSYQLYEDSSYKNKYILKNALKNHIPKLILNRTEITSFEGLLYYGLMDKNIDLIRNIFKKNSRDLNSYINLDMLNEILYRDSRELDNNDLFILWNSLCLVLWKKKLNELPVK